MEKDFLKISLTINQQLNQLLDLYKTDFMTDVNKIASTTESLASILQIFPGLDIFIEAWQKITAQFLAKSSNEFSVPLTGKSNCIIKLQQEFFEEHKQIYTTTIEPILNNIDTNHNYYLYLKNLHNLIKKYYLKLLDLINLDHNKKNRLIFYFNNLLDTIAPQNFLTINLELMSTTIENRGQNLFTAIEKFLTDLINSKGYFQIKTTDFSAFKIGQNLATTPGKIIFKNDLMELISYTPTTKNVYKAPILLIPPFINKYYILDLSANNSLVKWLVHQGLVVYIISWVNPTTSLADKQFSDYVLDGPLKAIDIITKFHGHPKLHLAGYCIGGTILSCALAYMQQTNDDRALSATHFMSLVDFSNLGNISALINEHSLNLLEKLINNKGYLDGRLLSMAFSALRPSDLIWPYVINNYLLNKPLKALDISYWNADITNLPANMYMFYLRSMCLHNKLKEPNEIQLNGISINLQNINVPIFSLAGDTDHITVWQAVYNSSKVYGGPVEFVLSTSGHIKGLINPPIDNKYSFKINTNPKLPATPEQWLADAEEHQGSWWPYWLNWLTNITSEKINAEHFATKIVTDFNNAPNAPGSYVLQGQLDHKTL